MKKLYSILVAIAVTVLLAPSMAWGQCLTVVPDTATWGDDVTIWVCGGSGEAVDLNLETDFIEIGVGTFPNETTIYNEIGVEVDGIVVNLDGSITATLPADGGDFPGEAFLWLEGLDIFVEIASTVELLTGGNCAPACSAAGGGGGEDGSGEEDGAGEGAGEPMAAIVASSAFPVLGEPYSLSVETSNLGGEVEWVDWYKDDEYINWTPCAVVTPENPIAGEEVTVTIYDEETILPIFELGGDEPEVYYGEEEDGDYLLTINEDGSATFTVTADLLANEYVWIGGEHEELGEAYAEVEAGDFLAGGNCEEAKALVPILEGSNVAEFDPLEAEDAGTYTVDIWYGEDDPLTAEFVLSESALLEGALPVSGLIALGLLGGACVITGGFAVRRRKK